MNDSIPEDLYDSNYQTIAARWPNISSQLAETSLDGYDFEFTMGDAVAISVNGIQLASRHDPIKEAKIQAETIPKSPTIYLYGFGMGFLAQHLLETRPELETLEIKIINLSIFKFVMHFLDISYISTHPSVRISLTSEDTLISTPFFASLHSLTLSDENCWKIRDQLLYATTTQFNNEQIEKNQELNARVAAFHYHKSDKYKGVSTIFQKYRNGIACVVGSGPTLEDSSKLLSHIIANNNGSTIIACDTAFTILKNHQINPNIVVTLDHNIIPDHFGDHDTCKSSLVFHPSTRDDVIKVWKGPKYYAISAVRAQSHLMKKEADNILITSGSVIHPAIDLAIAMGYKKIALFGADFSFPKEKTHAFWPSGKLGGDMKSNFWIKNGLNQKVRSNLNFAFYLYIVEAFIRKNKDVEFFNTSTEGALIAGTKLLQETAHEINQ